MLRIRFGTGSEREWLLSTLPFDCLQGFIYREGLTEARFLALAALAVHDFGTGERMRLDDLAELFEQRPLIKAEAGEQGRDPLWCAAGGPHALACSWRAGGFGPMAGGSCSVQCPPSAYACCSPGVGSECSCVSHNDNPAPTGLPPDPPPVAGDGGYPP